MGHAKTDCKAVLTRLYLYLDGEIAGAECAQIELHLDACGECLQHVGFERELKDMIRRRCSEREVPAGLLDRLRARLREL